MNNRVILVVLGLTFHCLLQGQSEWEVFKPITHTNEIEFHDNKAYAATDGGLLVIDLLTFEETLYTSNNSGIKGHSIEKIEILPNGHFWLHTYDAGIMYFDGNSYSHIYDLDKDWLNLFDFTAHNDTLWFSGFMSTLNYTSDTLLQTNTDLPYPSLGLKFDKNDNMWIASQSSEFIGNEWVRTDSIYKIKDGKIIESVEFPEYDVDRNYGFYFMSDNRHWLYSSEEVVVGPAEFETKYQFHYYDQGVWRRRELANRIEKVSIENDSVFSFSLGSSYCDVEGTTFICYDFKDTFPNIPSDFEGIKIVAKEARDIFWIETKNPLSEPQLFRITSDTITGFGSNYFLGVRPEDIALDCVGELICLDNDVQKNKGDLWYTIGFNYSNEDCYMTEVESDPHNCNNWVVSDERDCFSMWNIQDTTIAEYSLNTEDECETITFDNNGNIFLECSSDLYQVDTLGNTTILFPPKIRVIEDIHYWNDELLWVAGRDSFSQSIVLSLDDGVWQEHVHANSTKVKFLHEDQSGNMWFVGSDNMISKYDGTDWNLYPLDGLTSTIKDIAINRNGYIWIASSRGLLRWDGTNSFTYDYTNSDILSRSCEQLELVGDSILWIRHNIGLSKMNIDQSSATKEIQSGSSSKSNFSLFPNPANTRFTMVFSYKEKRIIDFINLQGQVVFSKESSELELQMGVDESNLSTGFYWIKAQGPSGTAIKKLVVH